jgi:hypothetical protein
MTTCDPGIEVYVSGTLLDPFDVNPLIIEPDDYLKVNGPANKSARFATWIEDPDPNAPEIPNTEAYPLPGGARGIAADLIPVVGSTWP